jgi:hypothetical protein
MKKSVFFIFFYFPLLLISCGDEPVNNETGQEEDTAKWLENSLSTGSTPYEFCFKVDEEFEPKNSQLSIIAPKDCDVIVIIKKSDKVYKHAYVRKSSSYIFSLPDGVYQPFFYYGNGWNPNKEMKSAECALLKGGFIENESYSKDDPQSLFSETLEYTLILQENGNFEAQSANQEEAF